MILAVLLSTAAGAAAQSMHGPQGAVRRFCELDSLGQRVATTTWPALAGVVEWPLEPVWDHAVLIVGYQVGPPLAYDLDSMVVDVHYSVVGQITANGQGDQAFVETIRLRVRPDEGGSWRIMGPPPPPHLFASRIDVAAARRAVQPGQPKFPTNSDFVWQMFRATGWNVDYETTAELVSGRSFRRVTTARPGDLIVYRRDGVPYHVGILDDETHVTSATINAGIVRTPIEMFAGEVDYLRLVEPLPIETATPTEVEALATPLPSAPSMVTAKPNAKPTPEVQKRSKPVTKQSAVTKARAKQPKQQPKKQMKKSVSKRAPASRGKGKPIVRKPTPRPPASRRR